MRGNYWGKFWVAGGAIGAALVCAAFGVAGKRGAAADSEKYDVVIANGRAARTPIS